MSEQAPLSILLKTLRTYLGSGLLYSIDAGTSQSRLVGYQILAGAPTLLLPYKRLKSPLVIF